MGLSLYQQHKERWGKGCGSEICEGVRKVFARGTLPCDILFIGEAPGEVENVLGQPFRGPAGQLLDLIIEKSVPTSYTYALTNLVCCLPRDEEDGRKATAPPDDAIRDCQPRLLEFIELASPKLIICVGQLAKDFVMPGYRWAIKLPKPIPMVDIKHPAYILRANTTQKGLLVQRATVVIQNAISDYLDTTRAEEESK